MAGNDKGNIGYPAFNVRTELGDAEVRTGFDVMLGATNHAIDQGAYGILNCLEYWKIHIPMQQYSVYTIQPKVLLPYM